MLADFQILQRERTAVIPPPEAIAGSPAQKTLISVRNLNVWYQDVHALTDVSFDVMAGEILAFIGPSGCGKTTTLKCLNRMLDGIRGVRIEGTILMDGLDIYSGDVDPPEFRRRFGWVAQKPNPFAFSIYQNVAYGAHIHGLYDDGTEMDAHVESCLRRASLWDEVKDVLHTQEGTQLSGGQQQRLCIARALGTNPEVLLMDEPTGSIDPIAANKIEQLMLGLRGKQTIIVITHSMMEAQRVADRAAMFHLGRMVELDVTEQIFDAPETLTAQNFIHGLSG